MGDCCQEDFLTSPAERHGANCLRHWERTDTSRRPCMEAGPGELEAVVVFINGACILFSGSSTLIFAGEDFGEPSFL